jgi:D-hydroxyproline dehydrogenase subunit gamma
MPGLPRIGSKDAWRPEVRFQVDGATFSAPEGETLAAALYASGLRSLRRNAEDGGLRGAFCFMGVCQECVVTIDGCAVEACRISVREGLRVETRS